MSAILDVQFVRAALTRQQVEEYALPKATDVRSRLWSGGRAALGAERWKTAAPSATRSPEPSASPDPETNGSDA
jgi:hypothetical protein